MILLSLPPLMWDHRTPLNPPISVGSRNPNAESQASQQALSQWSRLYSPRTRLGKSKAVTVDLGEDSLSDHLPCKHEATSSIPKTMLKKIQVLWPVPVTSVLGDHGAHWPASLAESVSAT